jgi:deazaflavin-dependent oxidoreductase (nitroreductase family)
VGSWGYDAFWGSATRLTTSAHKFVDRVTGGRFWRHFPGGAQVVWLTTTGRKSGQPRRTPLLAVRDGDAWVIAGSNAGQSKPPGWVFNVRANPAALLEVDNTTQSVTAIETTGNERERLYGELIKNWRGYQMYERNAGRVIPVFRLVPA